MAVSKKQSDSFSFDSGASRVEKSSVSEVKALEPLLELLLDLQMSPGQTSTSTQSENLSRSNSSEKPKKATSDKSLESSQNTDTESKVLDFLFEAVNPSVADSSEETLETSAQNHKSEHFDHSPENDVSFQKNHKSTENDQPKKEPHKQDEILLNYEDVDLTSLHTLLEVPTDAVDVSYSVTPVKSHQAETEVDLTIEESSPAESQSDPEELEEVLEAFESLRVESTASNSDDSLEQLQDLIFGSTRSDFEQLKQQIFESDLPEVRQLLETISSQLKSLEYQIYEPEQLIQLIRPWIADILNHKVNDSKEDIIQALKPIIDQVILARTKDNREQMSAAIADLIPEAIKHQIRNSPQEIAQAIGPEIGSAIREQIRLDQDEIVDALAPTMGKVIKEQVILERDSMVDALYPVIGSTITRYLGEAIQEINDKVSNAFSIEGINRKIRAKLQGISEAELIWQEVMKCTVQAVFLIHKGSGLIISEVQQSGEARLESEMLAGMLTAIRSFVNDCIVQAEQVQELNEIEYGDSRIVIEVAGYCYLAVIVQGEIKNKFLKKIRTMLIKITQKYGREIETFEGDPETVPPEILAELEKLMEVETKQHQEKSPKTLLFLTGIILGSVLIPLAIVQYRSGVIHRVETEVMTALDSEPELAIYRLTVDAQGNTVMLNGKLPNQRLREKAETIVQQIVPNWTVDNDIIAVKVPPDPVLVEAEVQRMTETLNQMNGISISTQYEPDQVTIEGKVIQPSDRENVTQAFENIEGVNSVVSSIQVEPVPIATRVYFNLSSDEFRSEDMIIKIYPVSQYLKQYPNLKVRIVGYSHPEEKTKKNSKLAWKRSQAVQIALESYGIDRRRMTAIGKNERPPGVEENQPDWLSRAVIFEIILPEDQGK
ncbi:BON domain protein [Lyngbya aestuarii BL J]|uniref:BON domain protein n=1 Tax=Lyngbya aestuarii BL J TaxID=1348334 RepID=U7QNS4_9CYAN|nr:BON domain-containing protein [Lyngbya aestuarii]ERT09634.1 BON domain protein [Lyngbya aestuarii BL J]